MLFGSAEQSKLCMTFAVGKQQTKTVHNVHFDHSVWTCCCIMVIFYFWHTTNQTQKKWHHFSEPNPVSEFCWCWGVQLCIYICNKLWFMSAFDSKGFSGGKSWVMQGLISDLFDKSWYFWYHHCLHSWKAKPFTSISYSTLRHHKLFLSGFICNLYSQVPSSAFCWSATFSSDLSSLINSYSAPIYRISLHLFSLSLSPLLTHAHTHTDALLHGIYTQSISFRRNLFTPHFLPAPWVCMHTDAQTHMCTDQRCAQEQITSCQQ